MLTKLPEFVSVNNVTLLQTILNKIEEVEQLLVKVLGEAIANVYLNMIDNQELFIERTAYEILWGYDEPLFGMLSLLGLGNSSQFAARVRNINVMLCYHLYLS